MMRIILSTNFSPWSKYSGGGQRSVHNIANHLSKQGVECHVIYTKSPLEHIDIREKVNYQIHWGILPAFYSDRKSIFRNASAYSVSKIAQRLINHQTIIHANGEESAFIGFLKEEKKFGLICTPRYPDYPEFSLPSPEKKPGIRTLISKNKYQTLYYSLHHADKIAPTSQYAAGMISKKYHIGEHKFEIIPNGIADELFQPVQRNPEKGSIFFFGRLEKTKGIDSLINVFAQLPEYTHLTVSGSGQYLPEFKKKVKKLKIEDRVIHIDWMNHREIAAQAAKSAIVCLPSLEESFGNSIAEAMASGAPVISTNAGSIPDLITHDRNGLLIDPGNEHQLKSQLEYLLSNLEKAEKLGNMARISAERFRWNHITSKWISLYENVLRQTHSE